MYMYVQVILEVLRFYPPIVSTLRESPSNNYYLASYRIPKGTTIAVSYYANHRNPDFWDDPEIFDPNRFDQSKAE